MADSDFSQVDSQADSGKRFTTGHSSQIALSWISPQFSTPLIQLLWREGWAGYPMNTVGGATDRLNEVC